MVSIAAGSFFKRSSSNTNRNPPPSHINHQTLGPNHYSQQPPARYYNVQHPGPSTGYPTVPHPGGYPAFSSQAPYPGYPYYPYPPSGYAVWGGVPPSNAYPSAGAAVAAPNGYPYGNPHNTVPPVPRDRARPLPQVPATAPPFQSQPPNLHPIPDVPQGHILRRPSAFSAPSHTTGQRDERQTRSRSRVALRPPSEAYDHSHDYRSTQSRNPSASSTYRAPYANSTLVSATPSTPRAVRPPTPAPPRSMLRTPEPDSSEQYKLTNLLRARRHEYPSIDWALWDKYSGVPMAIERDRVAELDTRIQALEGPDVDEIYLTSDPDKLTPFSVAIARWGPIKVVKYRGERTILIHDIILAIGRWLQIPPLAHEWASFDETFCNKVVTAYKMRRMYSKPVGNLVQNPKLGVRRMDTLLCYLRWNGLTLAKDFPVSKMVFLDLLDVNLEIRRQEQKLLLV